MELQKKLKALADKIVQMKEKIETEENKDKNNDKS